MATVLHTPPVSHVSPVGGRVGGMTTRKPPPGYAYIRVSLPTRQVLTLKAVAAAADTTMSDIIESALIECGIPASGVVPGKA